METIRIGKREIEPLFDLAAWEMIEERFGDLNTALGKLNNKEDAKECRKATIALAAILCKNAMEAGGEESDVTEEAMRRAIPIKRVGDVRLAVVLAINKGFKSDYDPADEAPVDVVLEELAKKNNPEE